MLHDGFYTNNYFNGVQLGIRGEVDYGGFVAQASLKAALGDMYQRLSIEGGGLTTAGTVFFPVSGGAGNNLAGGIFAQPSNIGSYGSHQLSGLAEVGARLGYRLTDRIVPYISYNALYVGGVLRPGDAVNRKHQHDHDAACGGVDRLRQLGPSRRTNRPDRRDQEHGRLDPGHQRRPDD